MWQTGQIDGPVRIVLNISCLSREADYLEYYIAMLIPGTKYNENQTQRGERLVYFQSFTAAPVFNTFQICRVFVKHRSIIHEGTFGQNSHAIRLSKDSRQKVISFHTDNQQSNPSIPVS